MSMTGRMIEITLRREQLIANCQTQRAELSALAQELQGPLRVADRVVDGVRYLRAHPVLLAAGVAALVVVRRRGWWQWMRRGIVLWRTYRALRTSAQQFGV